jgi:2-polyprenyl-3-methyl-5-hydroxy-6-metoxy-1,4-benzoquinol methylase
MDKAKSSISIFNEKAKQYQDKYMDQSLYHKGFDFFCQQIIKRDATVLEVGCGPGNITKYLLQQRPTLSITAIDLSENMLELARENNPAAHFIKLDCRNILNLQKKFDGIMCGFCLPYLSKDEAGQFISDASALLNLNGILYISTMEGDYSKSGYQGSKDGSSEQMYIYYHQENYLSAALVKNGFSILNLTRQKFPEADGSETIDLVIIAIKQNRAT